MTSGVGAVNRTELKQLANDRIDDATILLQSQRWSAAYYLAGYAVECSLKSCVLAHVDQTGVLFKDKKFSEKCWTHDLLALVRLADLETALYAHLQSSPTFAGFWGVVQDWSEIARYEQKTQAQATTLLEAVTNNPDGVFLWIQNYW